MKTPVIFHVRFGLTALLLTGFLATIHILLRGPFVDPSTDAAGFARMVTGANFALAWLVMTAGFVLSLFGVLALYLCLTQSQGSQVSFWGLALSLAGLALVQTLVGSALTWPVVGKFYLQGQTNVVEVAQATFVGLTATPLYLSGVLYSVGSFLLALAIWRSTLLPKWVAIPYALHAPLLAFALTFTTELLGAVLLIVAAGWLLRSSWKRAVSVAEVAHP